MASHALWVAVYDGCREGHSGAEVVAEPSAVAEAAVHRRPPGERAATGLQGGRRRRRRRSRVKRGVKRCEEV